MKPLGPFRLIRPLGSGAQGVVWEALHDESGAAVALKILTAARSRSAASRAGLREEARQVARLDHPALVGIWDLGEITLPHELGPPGTPWIALDKASGGTLRSRMAALDDDEALAVVDRILWALAHAHARGVLHRDIKPENVLFGLPEDRRPGWLVTDLGLAFRLGEARGGAASGGTLAYMAPEQLQGDERRFGAPTDLYAVACLAWELSTGAPPFGDDVYGRMVSGPPAFRPSRAVPQGLEAWLRRALQADPARRFPTAAQARTSWSRLGAGPRRAPSQEAASGSAIAVTWAQSTIATDLRSAVSPLVGPATPGLNDEADLAAIPAVFIPTEPASRPPSGRMVAGVGAGLLGWREPPLVGRAAERQELWRALVQAVTRGRTLAVRIVGPPGVGKSALVRWLAEEAAAAGWEVESVGGSPGGLRGWYGRRLGVAGLKGPALRQALLAAMPPEDAALAAAIIEPEAEGPSRSAASLARFLSHELGHRPFVWVVDEVSAEGQAMARALVEVSPGPGLVVVVGDEPVDDEVATIALGPLDPDDCRSLLRGVVGLAGEWAARIAEVADGNPKRALEIVEGWSRAGLLAQGPHGYAPAHGSIDVDHDRRGSVGDAEAWPAAVRGAVALAGLGGMTWALGPWRRACEAGGFEPDLALERLSAGTLAGPAPGRPGHWRWAEEGLGLAASRLEVGVGEARLHELWAEAIGEARDPEALVALARHQSGAGRGILASETWAQLGLRRHFAGDFDGAVAAFDEAETQATLAGRSSEDPWWPRWWVKRAISERMRGHWDEALALTARAVDRTQALGLALACADARIARGSLLTLRSRQREAIAEFDQALILIDGADEGLEARALLQRGAAQMELLAVDEGEQTLRLALSRSTLPDHLRAEALRFVSHGPLRRGQLAEARALIAQARDLHRQQGDRWGQAICVADLAVVSHLEGDLDGAEAGYRDAWALMETLGTTDRVVPRVNLALVRSLRDDWDEVIHHASAVLGLLARIPRPYVEVPAWSLLALARIFRGQWPEATAAIDGLDASLVSKPPVEGDTVEALTRALRQADDVGAPEALRARLGALVARLSG